MMTVAMATSAEATTAAAAAVVPAAVRAARAAAATTTEQECIGRRFHANEDDGHDGQSQSQTINITHRNTSNNKER
jgi:hypothetical protein